MKKITRKEFAELFPPNGTYYVVVNLGDVYILSAVRTYGSEDNTNLTISAQSWFPPADSAEKALDLARQTNLLDENMPLLPGLVIAF